MKITDTCLRTNSSASAGNRSYLPIGPAVFDRNVLAHDISGVVKALVKRAQTARVRVWRRGNEIPDHRHRRLLRPRRKRPRRRRAAEQRDELAALHSITSSARMSKAGDTSIRSARAVAMFITRSTFTACWTGRSAGFSPLRMRPV